MSILDAQVSSSAGVASVGIGAEDISHLIKNTVSTVLTEGFQKRDLPINADGDAGREQGRREDSGQQQQVKTYNISV